MKKIICLILAILFVISLAACDKGEATDKGGTSETTAPYVDTCIVSFENTDTANQSVEKGSLLQTPDTPNKSNCVFVGWYMDSDFTEEAKFPLTVDSDIKLYANFLTYQEAFREARKNTVGDTVKGFEYTYKMDISASCLGLALTGNTTGIAKYSSVGEVNFYDASTNSGKLLNDGSNYKIRRGTSLQDISLDENGKMKSFSVEQVDSNYKYNSSSLAKAVFEYSDDQLKSISVTDQKDLYKLNTSASASSVISLIANNINNPIVENLLCELPETSADTNLYVSFDNDKIDSYIYEFKISASELQFDLKYTLKFTDVGTANTIIPKKFENVALSAAEIKVFKDEATDIVNSFKNQESSGYEFKVETGVDYGITNGEINSTFEGTAYRKLQSNSAFFHNDITINSDYKNGDLYKDKGIDDVHIKLTKLSNGEVHIIEKKIFADSTQKIENFTDSDLTSFYLFDILTHSKEFSFAEKATGKNETVYTFGLTNGGVAALLTWLNTSLDIDPLDKATVSALVYGKFAESSVLVNYGTLSIKVANGKLVSIEVEVEGDFTTLFEGSADFTVADKAQVKLDMTITVESDGNTFEPFETVKDAK